jgi:hypothetical protein
LGGAAVGLFGPVTTVLADALSYLLSALGLTAIRGREEHRRRTDRPPVRAGELLDGWRHLLSHPGLRALFLNQLLVGGLIMATEPLLAVLLLGQLNFPPWQYGLAFAAPCVGGLVGSRLARRVVARHGRHRVIRTVGTLRAVWLIGLAFVQPGLTGLLTVIAVELAIIISMSLYNPVLATYRLEHTPGDRVARTLTAWSVSSSAAIALLSALGGLLADLTSARTAIAAAGLLILASPLLLPRRPDPPVVLEREPVRPAPDRRRPVQARSAPPAPSGQECLPHPRPRVDPADDPRAVRVVHVQGVVAAHQLAHRGGQPGRVVHGGEDLPGGRDEPSGQGRGVGVDPYPAVLPAGGGEVEQLEHAGHDRDRVGHPVEPARPAADHRDGGGHLRVRVEATREFEQRPPQRPAGLLPQRPVVPAVHEEPPAGPPVDVVGLGPQVVVGLVGDLAHDPGRHHEAVVTVQHPGHGVDLVGEPDLRVCAVPVPELGQQRLLPLRIQLDPSATQQPPEPTHVASFQQGRPGPRQCYASDRPRMVRGWQTDP